MDDETPSWLTPAPAAAEPELPTSTPAPSTNSGAAAPPPASFSLDTPAPATDRTSRSTTATDNIAGSILANNAALNSVNNKNKSAVVVDESDLPKMILVMRILNLAAAGLLIACSITTLVMFNPHISVWVTAIYASCGGLLVCCLETQLKFIRTPIALYFGFLFHSVYRFLFYCIMASVAWSYQGILGYITAITLVVVAVFNTYILCRYPTYRKMREKVAAEEDKRIEAKINQQIRNQATRSMFGG